MKKRLIFLLSLIMLLSLFTICEAKSSAKTAPTEPTISQVNLSVGSVTVYDYGDIKLHAYATGDALNDEAYILESKKALVGIELPAFTTGLDAWKVYIATLNKPMNDIFLCDHVTGASYVQGMNIYGTQGAKDSITNGATFNTTQGLYTAFGADFHGGPDMAQINKVVPANKTIKVAGIDFKLIDRGETYDLEIPAINAVYTHMLGKTTHSILTSTQHMDSMLAVLHEYHKANYNMILSAHSTPEGQDAVQEKISYVEKAKELAQTSTNATEFITSMKEAFPNYAGENYLEMSAGFLFK